MKKFKILSILLIFALSLSLLPVSAAAIDDEPEITAASAVLMNADTGEIYFSKNGDRTVQPASTTKMMTALLVVEAVERNEIALTESVPAYDDCQYNMDEESSNANPAIVPGETMTVKDLLYCAMLASANEACNILGEFVSGSVDAFVAAMNERASELGCTGTHFENANGLEQSGHYTTAEDFARIAMEAVKHSLFLEICGTLNYTVPATNVEDSRSLKNTNSLLNPDSDYYYEYAYGIKTGFFTNAGYCLVSAAAYNEMNIICVVMGAAESGDHFKDSLALYDWLFSNYSYRQILSSTDVVMTVPVEMGTVDSTGVRAESTISLILPNDYDTSGMKYQVTFYHEMEGRELEAPVNAGEVLGEVTVVELDENDEVSRVYGTSYLVATTTVEMSRLEYLRSQTKELLQTPVVRRIITLLVVLLAVYLLLILFYYIQRTRHRRSLRAARRERAARRIEEDSDWLEIPEDPDDDPDIGYFDAGEEPPAEQPRVEEESDSFFDSFFK